MTVTKIALALVAAGLLAGCELGEGVGAYGPDKSIDRGIDSKDLSEL